MFFKGSLSPDPYFISPRNDMAIEKFMRATEHVQLNRVGLVVGFFKDIVQSCSGKTRLGRPVYVIFPGRGPSIAVTIDVEFHRTRRITN